ncbi:MAG: NAD(P)H-hydrate epimerase, partial [Candidatus Bathyarchaeia archaeon]
MNTKKPITSREMRSLEANAEYYGVSMLQLMENAGSSVAQEVIARFPKSKKIAVFCGLGGNGGDGFVAARHLFAAGYQVSLQNKIPITEVTDSSVIPALSADVIVDALLGTGTKGKIKPPTSQMVDIINSSAAFKIAVDVPTGIDSDTGDVLGAAVKADLTLTFHRSKAGLEKAKKYVGELLVKNIGLPIEMEQYTGPGDVYLVRVPRSPTAHKGDFGRLLVIGGSEVYSGAPTLVSLGAMRTGVDIVYLAAPSKTAYAISSMSPDLITVKLEGAN